MATKATETEKVNNGMNQRVRIYLPEIESSSEGVKVDQYEHVTVNGETTLVRRGEYVDVTPDVFIQLKNRYKNI